MIYSKWNPISGGYDYFEGGGLVVGLGDDLPKPVLPGRTALGVASTEAGRPMPSGARKVGSGPFARGVISPLDRSALGVTTLSVSNGFLLLGVAAVLGVVWLRSKP